MGLRWVVLLALLRVTRPILRRYQLPMRDHRCGARSAASATCGIKRCGSQGAQSQCHGRRHNGGDTSGAVGEVPVDTKCMAIEYTKEYTVLVQYLLFVQEEQRDFAGYKTYGSENGGIIGYKTTDQK